MPKISQERSDEIREQIINACESLYAVKGFRDVTIKEIGDNTALVNRTSIYNYFRTKEEIFLALMQREYAMWNDALAAVISENDTLTKQQFAHKLAKSVEARTNLLKLLSMNLYDIEGNSSPEKLVEFKREYGKSLDLVGQCYLKFFPDSPEEQKDEFVFAFFPLMYGIYPYAYVTDKQAQAMRDAGVNYREYTAYELAYNATLKLL